MAKKTKKYTAEYFEKLRKQEKKEKTFLRKNKIKIEVIKREKGYTPRTWETRYLNYNYTLNVSVDGKKLKTMKQTATNQKNDKYIAGSKIYNQLKKYKKYKK